MIETESIKKLLNFIIIESAKDVQKKKGFFSIRDIIYEMIPHVTPRNIAEYRDMHISKYITQVLKDAGVEDADRHDCRGLKCYKFAEEVKEE